MQETKSIIYSLDELEEVVALLKSYYPQCAVFTFTGTLGAGKTTLVQQLLRASGVEGVITSPTFTYVNVYRNAQQQTFYHFDCYRIATTDDFIQAGFDEYLYQPNSWSFIEWPEVIEPLLKEKVCHCILEYHGEDKRKITCTIIK
jgi:tRNA threonylcarbamoyladenosine biosynthesis protein TsaE